MHQSSPLNRHAVHQKAPVALAAQIDLPIHPAARCHCVLRLTQLPFRVLLAPPRLLQLLVRARLLLTHGEEGYRA